MNSGTADFKTEFEAAKLRVHARSHGICERCRSGKVEHTHHKRGRTPRPGANDLDNLLDVCTPCHQYIHAHPQESYEEGWMIRRGT